MGSTSMYRNVVLFLSSDLDISLLSLVRCYIPSLRPSFFVMPMFYVILSKRLHQQGILIFCLLLRGFLTFGSDLECAN